MMFHIMRLQLTILRKIMEIFINFVPVSISISISLFLSDFILVYDLIHKRNVVYAFFHNLLCVIISHLICRVEGRVTIIISSNFWPIHPISCIVIRFQINLLVVRKILNHWLEEVAVCQIMMIKKFIILINNLCKSLKFLRSGHNNVESKVLIIKLA